MNAKRSGSAPFEGTALTFEPDPLTGEEGAGSAPTNIGFTVTLPPTPEATDVFNELRAQFFGRTLAAITSPVGEVKRLVWIEETDAGVRIYPYAPLDRVSTKGGTDAD